jgi:hypothetical protein
LWHHLLRMRRSHHGPRSSLWPHKTHPRILLLLKLLLLLHLQLLLVQLLLVHLMLLKLMLLLLLHLILLLLLLLLHLKLLLLLLHLQLLLLHSEMVGRGGRHHGPRRSHAGHHSAVARRAHVGARGHAVHRRLAHRTRGHAVRRGLAHRTRGHGVGGTLHTARAEGIVLILGEYGKFNVSCSSAKKAFKGKK